MRKLVLNKNRLVTLPEAIHFLTEIEVRASPGQWVGFKVGVGDEGRSTDKASGKTKFKSITRVSGTQQRPPGGVASARVLLGRR